MCTGVVFLFGENFTDILFLFTFSLFPHFPHQEENMYRTTRSPMMQPLVNSGMGMAPFFKVNIYYYTETHTVFYVSISG